MNIICCSEALLCDLHVFVLCLALRIGCSGQIVINDPAHSVIPFFGLLDDEVFKCRNLCGALVSF